MADTKLVKKLFVLILLLCTETLQVKGIQANNEEESDTPDAQHIVYDQRQSGKYNIHVVIKDVAIIEMDQNEIADQSYSDEDYYYDEGDLTVKPLIIKTSTTSANPLEVTTTTIKTNIPTLQTTIYGVENQSVKTTTSAPPPPTTTNFIKMQNNSEDLSTYQPALDTKSRSKIEAIYAIEEPVLLPRHHLQGFNYGLPAQAQAQARDGSQSVKGDSKIFKNSRIYKVKLHRSQQLRQIAPQSARCRSFQYRDARGNCRGKRSSSGSIL